MRLLGAIVSGLQGAVMLAMGRPEGVGKANTGASAITRSFWAIPLCLPAVIGLKLLDWRQEGLPARPATALGRYLLLFLVGWLVFVVVSHHLAKLLNKLPRWPVFIVVWSYCSVVENLLVALGGLPSVLGAPVIAVQVSSLVTIGWAFWLEWYGIRLALQVGPLTATLLLMVDFIIGMMTAILGATPR